MAEAFSSIMMLIFQARHAILGTGMLSVVGKVTDRNSSSENTRPRKCETIVFADACKDNM